MKIDLKDFFMAINNDFYCLVKKSDIFPKYLIGSDFDIFCYDIKKCLSELLSAANNYLYNGYELKATKLGESQIQLDLLKEKELVVKFDLYENLPKYHNIQVKEYFFASILENRQKISINDFSIYVPNKIDEIIIRYLEYHEYFALRPDKIKHIEFIEKELSDANEVDIFFKKLHYFIKLPRIYDAMDLKGASNHSKIREVLGKIQGKSIKQLIILLIKKINRIVW